MALNSREAAGVSGGGPDNSRSSRPLQISVARLQRAVFEGGPAAADRHRPEQQKRKAEREEAVACVDRVLRIAQQMGEAKLTGGTMAGLRGVAVGHPDLWPVAVEEVRDHRGGSARHDDVADRRRAQRSEEGR